MLVLTMSTLWDRRYQRVDFRAPVQVARRDDAENENAVSATAMNLSVAGIFVTAPEPPNVGTEVVCSVPLSGELRPLRGRVAWVRASPRGMGIEFIDLSTDDSRVLRETCGRDDRDDHPIRVWFEGLREPIGAKAVLTSQGIRLRAALPFLRMESVVRFAPADRVEEVHLGTLGDVRLVTSPGEPAVIEVDVSLKPPARGRVARPGSGWAPTDTVSGVAVRPSPTPTPTPETTGKLKLPSRRLVWALRWIAAGLILGAGVLVSLELWGRVPMPFLDVRVPAPPPAPPPAAAPKPAPAPAPALRAITPSPGRLFLPVDGSLEGLERLRLGDPPGVVITLPHATTPLATGEHPIASDAAFRVVKVRVRPEGGIKLRVFFRRDPPATAIVEAVPGGVAVVLPAVAP
jgi:hypothetical protein